MVSDALSALLILVISLPSGAKAASLALTAFLYAGSAELTAAIAALAVASWVFKAVNLRVAFEGLKFSPKAEVSAINFSKFATFLA